jgi:serine/threonine protein kinase
MTIPSPIRVGPFCGESLIGEGSFASVWRAFHVSTQLPVAIKVVPKTSVDSEAAQTHLIREITLMRQINHPFIASLFHVSEDSTNYYLVMEFADCGSLRDRINLLGQLNETESRHYFCELVWVIEYLHSEIHIAHRDLKCENILFDRYDNIRVIDFGLSRVCDKRETMLTVCGSPAYTAPEIIQSQPYTKAADIWSLGVVLYGMTVGYLSFNHQDVPILLRMIVNDTISYPDRLTPALRDVLQRLLRKEPD